MLEAAIQVLLYGLVAGLSPLAFAATLAVLPAGRLKALGFGTAFVVAQVLTCSVFVIIGIAATGPSRKSHPGIQATLAILLALALIGLALRVRRKPATPKESSNARMQALLERLGQLRFLTTVVAGFLLGIGGKRLVLTGLAATTIVTADVGDAGEAVLVVVYVAVATALVWGPVILLVLLGKRAVALLEGAQREVVRRQPQVTVYALLALAALLVISAVSVLLT